MPTTNGRTPEISRLADVLLKRFTQKAMVKTRDPTAASKRHMSRKMCSIIMPEIGDGNYINKK